MQKNKVMFFIRGFLICLSYIYVIVVTEVAKVIMILILSVTRDKEKSNFLLSGEFAFLFFFALLL